MATPLPDRLKEILDGRNWAHLTTLDPDGSPQATAIWIMRDGNQIVFNTAERRRKWRNMKRDARVALSISPADDPSLDYSIQGRVVDMRTSDGIDVIDRLAQKYLGQEKYPWLKPGMVRVTVIVEATRIASNK